jgi:hypothetical protein
MLAALPQHVCSCSIAGLQCGCNSFAAQNVAQQPTAGDKGCYSAAALLSSTSLITMQTFSWLNV